MSSSHPRIPVANLILRFRGRPIRLAASIAASATLFLAATAQATPTSISLFNDSLIKDTAPEALALGPDGNVWFGVRGTYLPASSIGRVTPDGSISLFSEGLHPKANPVSIVAGPDGNLWFADSGDCCTVPPAIGRVTPEGTITEFSAGLLDGARPREIIDGPEGNLWFVDRPTAEGSSPAIGTITPAGTISEFMVGGPPRSIAVGSDGNVWFTYGGGSVTPAIGRVTHGEGGTTLITLFHTGLGAGSQPRGITLGPDGNLWFVDESATNPALGRVTPDGVITEFSAGLRPESQPTEITSGPDGNLWFTDWNAAVGRITPDGLITEFDAQAGQISTPYDIASGPDGNLWFTDYNESAVGKVTPGGSVTLFTQGLDHTQPNQLISGPGQNLWFTDSGTPTVGRITPGDDSPVAEPVLEPQRPSGPPARSFAWVGLARMKTRAGGHGWAPISLRCDGTTLCSGRFTLTATDSSCISTHTIKLAGPTMFSIDAGSTAAIPIRLLAPGLKLLRRQGSVRALVSVFKTNPFPPERRDLHLLIRYSRGAPQAHTSHFIRRDKASCQGGAADGEHDSLRHLRSR